MNFLSIFVLIPLQMLAGLWAAQGIKAIRGVEPIASRRYDGGDKSVVAKQRQADGGSIE